MNKSLGSEIALQTLYMFQDKPKVLNISYPGKVPDWLFASLFN